MTLPPALTVTLGYQVVSIRRSEQRTPVLFETGQRYFLLVWPDGLEERLLLERYWYGSASVRGALDVEIIDVRDDFVVEETHTRNQPPLKRFHYTSSVPPPGRGWQMADASHDKYTTWARLRDWVVVA